MVSQAEHRFWLQILYEHAIFLYDHLSPREHAWIRQAESFLNAYADLMGHLPAELANQAEFAREALLLNERFRAYQLALMRARINNDVVLNLTPAFISGIINELDEYQRLLSPLAEGRPAPPASLFQTLSLWIPDQIGHASLLIKDLDLTERDIATEAGRYEAGLTQSFLETLQLAGYARAMGPIFPDLQDLVAKVAGQVQGFYKLVKRAVYLYETDRLLNRATAMFLKHHFLESDYFLMKLGETVPQLAQRKPELFIPPK